MPSNPGKRAQRFGTPVVAGVGRILPEAECAHADNIVAGNWSPPIKAFERGLDKGAQAFGAEVAYIEITPREPGTHLPS